jgi:hypothetical protein
MTMTANHVRALVSNRGDGNWGAGNTNNQFIGAGGSSLSIFFPHGSAKTDAPSSSQDLTNNINFIGWGCKSNWIVQGELVVVDDDEDCAISVYAVRPTGVKELVMAATALAHDGALSFTHGGIDAEVIQGPISYFEFVMTTNNNNPKVNCFVIGWNEGDIIT